MQIVTGLMQLEIEGIAGVLGPAWSMVPHQDLDGQHLAMIMPADDDRALPTWVVHREGELLRLDVCRDDTYSHVGAYAALPPLLVGLQAMLDTPDRH